MMLSHDTSSTSSAHDTSATSTSAQHTTSTSTSSAHAIPLYRLYKQFLLRSRLLTHDTSHAAILAASTSHVIPCAHAHTCDADVRIRAHNLSQHRAPHVTLHIDGLVRHVACDMCRVMCDVDMCACVMTCMHHVLCRVMACGMRHVSCAVCHVFLGLCHIMWYAVCVMSDVSCVMCHV